MRICRSYNIFPTFATAFMVSHFPNFRRQTEANSTSLFLISIIENLPATTSNISENLVNIFNYRIITCTIFVVQSIRTFNENSIFKIAR